MFTRLIVPLDGSKLAERALPFAGELANLGGLPVSLVRVFDVSPLEAEGPDAFGVTPAEIEQMTASERTRAEDYLETTAGKLAAGGLDVTHSALPGDPAETLVGLARPGDLIVMASHGRGGPARWFLGSVAEAVVRRSPVPVLLVRASTEPPASPYEHQDRTYSRILLALDGSSLAEQALATAEALARLTGAPLHLVRVVDLAPYERVNTYGLGLLGPSTDALVAEEQMAAQKYLHGVQRRLAERGIPATTEVRIGRVPRDILAAETPEDLLVIASHGRTGATRWLLGSIAEEVMRRSPGPVVLVRASADATLPREALVTP